jgi:hypothetical protein
MNSLPARAPRQIGFGLSTVPAPTTAPGTCFICADHIERARRAQRHFRTRRPPATSASAIGRHGHVLDHQHRDHRAMCA